MSKFTKKDGHPRFAHFAIFVFLIMATTFGLTKIGNRSLPNAEAQTAGLVHYWNMDTELSSNNSSYFPDLIGNIDGIDNSTLTNGVSIVPNSLMPNPNNRGSSVKFSGMSGYSNEILLAYNLTPPDTSLKAISFPFTFMTWLKFIDRSQEMGLYGISEAPIFASQNTVNYCGVQVLVENLTPTYKLIFDVMDCSAGQGGSDYSLYRKSVTSTIPVPVLPFLGLVGSYSFNLSEMDSSAYNNNGTSVGLPPSTAGKVEQALSFTGAGQYVTVQDNINNSLDLTTELTVSAWVKLNSSLTSGLNIVSKWGTGGLSYAFATNWQSPFNQFYLALERGGPGSDGLAPGDSFVTSTNADFQNGKWTHLAATYKASSVKLYQDGVLMTQTTSGSIPSSIYQGAALLKIGGGLWDGAIDEVKLYNRALSSTEIKTLYDGSPWAHIAVVVKGPPDASQPNNVRLYINGEDKTGGVDGSATISGAFPPGGEDTGTLGSRFNYYGTGLLKGFFNGYMDDVKIYNRALSSCEIKVSSGSSSSCPNGRCEQSCGENFLNCWADCKPKAFRDF